MKAYLEANPERAGVIIAWYQDVNQGLAAECAALSLEVERLEDLTDDLHAQVEEANIKTANATRLSAADALNLQQDTEKLHDALKTLCWDDLVKIENAPNIIEAVKVIRTKTEMRLLTAKLLAEAIRR